MQNPHFSYPEFVRSHTAQETRPAMYLVAATGLACATLRLFSTSEDFPRTPLADCCFHAQMLLNLVGENLDMYKDVPREVSTTMFDPCEKILNAISSWALTHSVLDDSLLHRSIVTYIPALFACIRSHGFDVQEIIDLSVEQRRQN